MTQRTTLRSAIAVALLALASRTVLMSAADDDVFVRSRATYAALRSYADTGTVDAEFGPAGATVRERHSFKTYYRAPRRFYFDFVKQDRADRYVVWSDDEAFHTWWQTTGVSESYGKGEGATAFILGTVQTINSLTQLSPLLFPQAGLAGTLTELGDASLKGKDTIAGHSCYKVVGVAKSVYGATGHTVNVRATTVWIDTETLMVRRVLEDAAQGSTVEVNRVTTTFEPVANPVLDDARFRFTPPAAQ